MNKSSEEIQLLIEKCAEQNKIIKGAGITKEQVTFADNNNNNEMLFGLKRKYYDLHLPCVFLENGMCSIHEVRPVDCMAFRQYASPCFCSDTPLVAGAVDYFPEKQCIYAIQDRTGIVDNLPFRERLTIGPVPLMIEEAFMKFFSVKELNSKLFLTKKDNSKMT